MSKTRISLSADAFKSLVAGNIVKYGDVEIVFQDIGWINMISIIQNIQGKVIEETIRNVESIEKTCNYKKNEETS